MAALALLEGWDTRAKSPRTRAIRSFPISSAILKPKRRKIGMGGHHPLHGMLEQECRDQGRKSQSIGVEKVTKRDAKEGYAGRIGFDGAFNIPLSIEFFQALRNSIRCVSETLNGALRS